MASAPRALYTFLVLTTSSVAFAAPAFYPGTYELMGSNGKVIGYVHVSCVPGEPSVLREDFVFLDGHPGMAPARDVRLAAGKYVEVTRITPTNVDSVSEFLGWVRDHDDADSTTGLGPGELKQYVASAEHYVVAQPDLSAIQMTGGNGYVDVIRQGSAMTTLGWIYMTPSDVAPGARRVHQLNATSLQYGSTFRMYATGEAQMMTENEFLVTAEKGEHYSRATSVEYDVAQGVDPTLWPLPSTSYPDISMKTTLNTNLGCD